MHAGTHRPAHGCVRAHTHFKKNTVKLGAQEKPEDRLNLAQIKEFSELGIQLSQ